MSGQAGGRGYHAQSVFVAHESLKEGHDWVAVTVESKESEKVDIHWEYQNGTRKSTQVKSSINPFYVPKVKESARELEASQTAEEYELILLGPTSGPLAKLQQIGKVNIPTPKQLDIQGLIHQSAHRLELYLTQHGLHPRSASERETIVEALVTRISTLATTAGRMTRDEFNQFLCGGVHNSSTERTHTVLTEVEDAFFYYQGRDAGGGQSVTSKRNAKWISYAFRLNFFNNQDKNIGLLGIRLHFAVGGRSVLEMVPTLRTDEVRMSTQYCPPVSTLTLPSREWVHVPFLGGVGGTDRHLVADCDEIYLKAKSVDGETIRIGLGKGIAEEAH